MAQLFYKYGTMNSGKSIEILKVAHNYEEQGKKVVLFTAAIDTRVGKGVVSSRVEAMNREAIAIHQDDNVFQMVQDINLEERLMCVLIDECQFMTKEQIYQLARVVDELHIPVIAVGLKNDFENNLFEGSKALIEVADKLEEVKTICWYCNKKATMNLRVNKEMEGQIAIGGNDDYKAVCRKHYMTLHNEYKER